MLSLLNAMIAVFWAFFGVRKSVDHKKDIASLKLIHVIFAGLLGAIIFVISLLVLVSFIVN
jgi:hypothetical protein